MEPAPEPKKKYLKFIIAGIGIYVLFLIIGIIVTIADWISVAELLAYFIVFPFMLGIIIFGAWKWSKKKKDTEIKEERKKKLDASTIIPWAKKMMLDRWHTSFEPGEPVYKSVGNDNVPIMIVSGYAPTAKRRYNIFANLLEPDAIYSIIEGYLSPEEINQYSNDLAYNPRHTNLETIRVKDEQTGIIREVIRQLPEQKEVKKSD